MEWVPIVEGGYTRARKWLVTLDDGTRVFAKEAPAIEIAVYESVTADFLPRVHDIREGILFLEDLSHAHWPPPYPDDVSPLFDTLDEVARTEPPTHLRRFGGESLWERIATAPGPLLALDLCPADWLERALPLLIEAEARVPRSGSGLVHNDIWARNLCFAERGAVLVDWAQAEIGNPQIDVAFALLSLRVEGAPSPQVENEAGLAAFVTGIVATEASAPPPAWAVDGQQLREDQKSDLAVALPWVAEQIGCPLGGSECR
jgi:Phosphotransferase enzyme family